MPLQNQYIEDDIATIVSNVNTALTPYLQGLDSNLNGVYFEFGTIDELIETLSQKSKSNQWVYRRYPLVFLFVDVKEMKNKVTGNLADLNLRLAIIAETKPTFKAKERLDLNFKRIIMPIYHEFMRQISISPFFHGASSLENINHNTIRRYYWGRESETGNTSNKLPDFIDGLEIENLELKYYLKRC